MNTHQTDDVIAGYRKATDAQQQVIADLRHEISILRNKIGALDRHMNACRKISKCPDDDTLAVWLKGCVRLDDPVVTGLVEALRYFATWESGLSVHRPLSAYEALVKEVSCE